MKNKLKLLGLALIAGGTMFAQTHVAVGIGIGSPAYPAPVYGAPAYAQQYMPPCPGPGYTWVDGYWTTGPRRSWVNGFWRAPVVNTYRVAPRYDNHNNYRNDRGHDRDDHNRGRFENSFRGHGR